MVGNAGAMVSKALDELRTIINQDAQPDEPTLRRILLHATAGIADPATAADLHQGLYDALFAVDLARSVGAGSEETTLWTKKAVDVVERVETASRVVS